MANIRLNSSGAVILRAGKASCECCCPTTLPAIQWDSRSASKSKCGYSEYGTPSTPPKKYLTEAESATITKNSTLTETGWVSGGNCCYTKTVSGSGSVSGTLTKNIDPSSCETTSGAVPDDGEYSGTISLSYTDSTNPECYPPPGPDCSVANYSETYSEVLQWGKTYSAATNTVISPTEMRWDYESHSPSSGGPTPTLCCTYTMDSTDDYENHRVFTLSDEYTTDALKANTLAALGSFPGTWSGTAGSYFNLTTDELTNTIREAKYRFQYTVPSGSCYRIEWLEDGVAKSWTWGGTGTPGATAYTPEYTIPIPTTNSTATVTSVTYSCTGCA